MNKDKVTKENGNLPIFSVRVSWLKKIIIPIGVIILLWLFRVHVVAGFAGAIGLMLGSFGEKLGWWNN